jgi:acetyltransferase
LPESPDLAVIATPIGARIDCRPRRKGTRAAIVLTAGLGERSHEMLEGAHPYCLRILGPNCIGLMLPNIGLNASFAHRAPLAGDLAFVSQSGALITAVGEMADTDLSDMLDYLAYEQSSRASAA